MPLSSTKVIIQCAGDKSPDAGYFRDASGQRVVFVARPNLAPSGDGSLYARPDDRPDIPNRSWRDRLMEYNDSPGSNPFGLVQAYKLYQNRIYRDLAEHVGPENLFILSAGWGLVRSTFLLPAYDITFSYNKRPCTHRSIKDGYQDFRHMGEVGYGDRILYFGGGSYVPTLLDLTKEIEHAEKLLYFNSKTLPSHAGWRATRFRCGARTNWHYLCARAFINGELET